MDTDSRRLAECRPRVWVVGTSPTMTVEWKRMFQTSCHCGAVKIAVPAAPEQVTSCNCSLCFKLGTLWGYYTPDDLTFIEGGGTTVPYVQGDRMLESHRCATCGCVTHWIGVEGPAIGRAAINVRLGDRTFVEGLPVKWINGAGDWELLDGPGGKPIAAVESAP